MCVIVICNEIHVKAQQGYNQMTYEQKMYVVLSIASVSSIECGDRMYLIRRLIESGHVHAVQLPTCR